MCPAAAFVIYWKLELWQRARRNCTVRISEQLLVQAVCSGAKEAGYGHRSGRAASDRVFEKEGGIFMGTAVSFSCKDCGYSEEFFIGSGMLDYEPGKSRELFNCPACGFLSCRKVPTQYIEAEDDIREVPLRSRHLKCRKCGTAMNWIGDAVTYTCPKCQSHNCTCEDMMLLWD